MSKDDHINMIVLIATFRSFHEQLHNLKGVHKQKIKKHFNLMINQVVQYERMILDSVNEVDDNAINEVYDGITEVIYMIRDQVKEKTK